MAFYGSSFVFDGVPCDDFELMMYDMDSASQSSGSFASTVTVVEETLASKWKPIFYGTKFGGKLEFDIVFGVNQRRIDEDRYLDRGEIDVIASWLTGVDGYRYLSIVQEDMLYVRYRCYISALEIVEYGAVPWALKATVTCDSPYAYLYPHEYSYDVNGSALISILNESSLNGYYYPVVEFTRSSGDKLIIENQTDGGRKFVLEKIPATVTAIRVDNDRRVITNNADLNLYEGCNFKFLRLKRGYNTLKVTGNGGLKIICEFPVNAGC